MAAASIATWWRSTNTCGIKTVCASFFYPLHNGVIKYKIIFFFLTGTRTCDYLLRYENNLFQHYNDLLDAYPKRYRGSKMKTESSQQPHYLHHEVLTYPLTPSNLSDSVVRSVEQYYWMDMCLFGYDTSIEPPSSKL